MERGTKNGPVFFNSTDFFSPNLSFVGKKRGGGKVRFLKTTKKDDSDLEDSFEAAGAGCWGLEV